MDGQERLRKRANGRVTQQGREEREAHTKRADRESRAVQGGKRVAVLKERRRPSSRSTVKASNKNSKQSRMGEEGGGGEGGRLDRSRQQSRAVQGGD